jgi:hypothetical protein
LAIKNDLKKQGKNKFMTKRLADPIIHCLFPVFLFCAIGIPGRSQNTPTDELESAFTRYQLQAFQEKVFVHVDRSFYLAGETIWFKVYGVDENFLRPTAGSRVAYVEIIGKDQKAVLQARIALTDGKGNGSFQIPISLASGNYIFRAYTSWMKNFSPDLYFSQPLTIINTLNSPPDSVRQDTVRDFFAGPISGKPDIQFFPEGGNLVYGLYSKIGFKAVIGHGKGIYCKGFVVNQKKDTLSRFEVARFGMGNFSLTPVKGDSYEAVIKVGDSVIRKKLPAIYDQGTVMALTDMDKDKLILTIHTNTPLRDPSNRFVYLFIHTRQLVKSVQAASLTNNEAHFFIDKKALGDGISQLTLFNSDRLPIGERLYFKQPEAQLRIAAKLGQSEYGLRKKVDIDLSAMDQSGRPAMADLSMSVYWIDSLQPMPQLNILSGLLLTGDLKGWVESPQYYLENTGPEALAAADNLMLTQGWSRFRWEDVLRNSALPLEFQPEPDGAVISGKVIDKRTGQPATSPVTGYLSIPGKNFEFSTAVSKANGDIRFDTKPFYGNNEIIVQTNSQTDSNYRIDLANPYSESFSSAPMPDFTDASLRSPGLLYRSINSQVENTYQIDQKHRLAPLNPEDTLPFYGTPDLQYYLDEFTRFVTLEEVIREYVLDVHLKEQSGKYDFRIRNSLFNNFFEDAPLVLLDGTPVFDADKIVAMDPLKIKKIDVITHKYYTNSLVTDGVLSYKTFGGDLAGYPLDPNAVAVQYTGLQQQREFYSPVYEKAAQAESRVPDFRNLLLWSPELKTDEQGKTLVSFYTSDLAGTYVVVLQGMTKDGLPGSVVNTFRVVK